MVSKGREYDFIREVLLEKSYQSLQNVQLVISALVPHVVGGEIPCHVHPLKLWPGIKCEQKKFICKAISCKEEVYFLSHNYKL